MTTFAYPGYNPTVFFQLRDPEKDDDEIPLEEIYLHPTEGGQFKSNVKSSCFGEYERKLTFVGLCKEQKDEFIQFIVDSVGNYIKYTDYNGNSWMTQITQDQINPTNSPGGWDIDLNLLIWEV